MGFLFIHPSDVAIGQLPNPELLKGMATFNKKGTPPTEQDAASILSQLGNLAAPVGPQKTAVKLITVAAGLPALPKKVVDQIQTGQYIDFSELPPAKGRTRPLPSQEEGHVIVVRAEDLSGSRKMIPDLATWLQCFALYMAVVTDKEPDRTSNLLAYMVTIAKASVKYSWPSWVVYDQNFRQEAADNGLKDWAKVDPSIYTQCFTNAAVSDEKWCKNCQSIDHGTNTCPLQVYSSGGASNTSRKRQNTEQGFQPSKKRAPPHSLPQTCKLYNRFNGDCKFGELCTFQHKCDICGKHGHPRSRCPDQLKSKGPQ